MVTLENHLVHSFFINVLKRLSSSNIQLNAYTFRCPLNIYMHNKYNNKDAKVVCHKANGVEVRPKINGAIRLSGLKCNRLHITYVETINESL